jgi:hypothetical protein
VKCYICKIDDATSIQIPNIHLRQCVIDVPVAIRPIKLLAIPSDHVSATIEEPKSHAAETLICLLRQRGHIWPSSVIPVPGHSSQFDIAVSESVIYTWRVYMKEIP